MTLTKPKNATKRELEFIHSLEEGLKYARDQKAKGIIVERHRLRATKEDVKEFRQKLHLSQAQCALVLDIDVETVKKWEQGKNQVPGPVSLWIRSYVKKPEIVAALLNEQLRAMLQAAMTDPFVVAWEQATKGGPVEGLSKDDKAFSAEVERREKRGEAKRVSGKEGLRKIREGLKRAGEGH